MLPRLIFCFCFTMVLAKPALKQLAGDTKLSKTSSTLEYVDRILTKFVQRSSAIQQLATTRSLEAHLSLASFPRECSVEGAKSIETERNNLLANYYKCNVLLIVEDVATLTAESAKYVYNLYKDSSIIVTDVLFCTTGFNPFTFFTCILKAISVIPAEIKDIIELTEDYKDSLEELLPIIEQEIESCFNRTKIEYDQYLNSVMEKVNLCASNRIE